MNKKLKILISIILVKGLYNEEVRHLNSILVKNAQEGFAFKKKIYYSLYE